MLHTEAVATKIKGLGSCNTPHLTDTSQQQTPTIWQTIPKSWLSLDILQLLCNPGTADAPLFHIKDSFRSPNLCTQTVLNDPDLVDTHWPFQQDSPPLLLELTITLALLFVLLIVLLASACPSQPVYSKEKLWKRSHIVLNSPITHTTPAGSIPEASELGTPC